MSNACRLTQILQHHRSAESIILEELYYSHKCVESSDICEMEITNKNKGKYVKTTEVEGYLECLSVTTAIRKIRYMSSVRDVAITTRESKTAGLDTFLPLLIISAYCKSPNGTKKKKTQSTPKGDICDAIRM